MGYGLRVPDKGCEDMTDDVKLKKWRLTAVTGIPVAGLIAVLITWAWSGGALANRVSQVEDDMSELKVMYRQTGKDISDIKVQIGVLVERSGK